MPRFTCGSMPIAGLLLESFFFFRNYIPCEATTLRCNLLIIVEGFMLVHIYSFFYKNCKDNNYPSKKHFYVLFC